MQTCKFVWLQVGGCFAMIIGVNALLYGGPLGAFAVLIISLCWLNEPMKKIQRTGRQPLPALTGLRFLAALYVVGFHYAPPLQHGADVFMSAGYSAVSLFFCLSGFVLAYNYLDVERDAITVDRGRFWLSRFARVYPAYLLALAVTAPIFISRMMEGADSICPGVLAAPVFSAACVLHCFSRGARKLLYCGISPAGRLPRRHSSTRCFRYWQLACYLNGKRLALCYQPWWSCG